MKKYSVHTSNGHLFAMAERVLSDSYEMVINKIDGEKPIRVVIPNQSVNFEITDYTSLIKKISDHAVIMKALADFDLFIYEVKM